MHREALVAAVQRVLARLDDSSVDVEETGASALDVVCAAFGLTGFERDVLVLAAAMEIEPSAGDRCAKAGGVAYPTFGLALAVLDEPHWSALTPVAPLRRWRLLEVADQGVLTAARLRIDERVLHFLLGVPYLTAQLHGLVSRVPEPDGTLPPAHQRVADAVAAGWHGDGPPAAADLVGADRQTRAEIAAAVAAAGGVSLYVLRGEDLPGDPVEMEALGRLWEREAMLLPAALLVEADGADRARLDAFLGALAVPVLVSCDDPLPPGRTLRSRHVVPALDAEAQRQLWAEALGRPAAELAAQFSLPAHVIRAAARRASASDEPDAAWQAGLAEARMALDELGRRMEPSARWEDLVLPEPQRETLREIVAHVRQRGVVYEEWGFASVLRRGLGVTALFAGGSGTGKTLAAEVLAASLGLDLFVIDLSQVISKYIGETEKNLRRVFDAAERGGALLLFDEADALFGKRSEIKDSHDRYANIEVSYLLMRMEAYRGLAILTTNMKKALDTAFLRRIRFVVDFPFPGPVEREEIWRRVIPFGAPADGLDFSRLAQLTIAGGSIRNVALSAAFLAAEEGARLGMRHVRAAARTEYQKLDRSLTPAEVAGWV
ncbi:AAA family ATPase [Actinoplanes sp. NPDC024001]|uniref:ATP-binding protein n=1 Tax=Actinoplanes sp. NPDC024001 TaxID=3154598 RepID=UPI0033E352D8